MASMTTAKSSRRPAPAPDSFLEALQDLRSSVASEAKIQVKKVFTDDIPEAFGLMTPNQPVNMESIRDAEMRGEKRAEARFSNRLDQERLVYLKSESDTKAQIQNILGEIKSLAKASGALGRQVEIAAMQAPTNPGIYHRNFFDQLRTFIAGLRRKVEQSKDWLATTNARAGKKSYFWGNVQTSGTKFMLSQERYMVTTTG